MGITTKEIAKICGAADRIVSGSGYGNSGYEGKRRTG